MHGFDDRLTAVTGAIEASSESNFGARITDEAEWRAPPQCPAKKVVATRWRTGKQDLTVARAETPKDYHVVGITMARTNLLVSIHDRVALDEIAMPGGFLVTEPGVAASCIFKGPFDELHLFLPNDLIAECADDSLCLMEARIRSEAILTHDPISNQLALALLHTEHMRGSLSQLYLDSIGAALIAHLLSGPNRPRLPVRKRAGLPRWRLRRAMEYIDANLAECLTLPGIAQAVGLSSMHFAAQFRVATGLRPHEYVLRRRIERAQQMLLETSFSLAEIAFSVGFRSQSHFTSVFTKFLGRPPQKWKRHNELADAAPGEIQ
ncbi:MAG: AraC family transcriptional regulator [Methylovirgula sp.]|uniref:AraC family transcriptional regulator n=1 Tax=Methylovirgula sp. TaxID=1978224 RepID=UPI003076523D